MIAGQYPIRTFLIPSGYAPITTNVYTNSAINNLYVQFSASLGQLGSLVSNSRIQGNISEYNSYIDYLIMALYVLRSWYNGGVIFPNIPTSGTISAYWVQTNTSVLTNAPLFVNVPLNASISSTVTNIQSKLPSGYIASVYNTNEVYIECQYTEAKLISNSTGNYAYEGLNYIYWVVVSGGNTYTGWSMIDYLPSLFYEQAASIINKCKLIQNVITLSDMEFDNAYVSLGQPAQAAISGTSTCFNWLNFANGIF